MSGNRLFSLIDAYSEPIVVGSELARAPVGRKLNAVSGGLVCRLSPSRLALRAENKQSTQVNNRWLSVELCMGTPVAVSEPVRRGLVLMFNVARALTDASLPGWREN